MVSKKNESPSSRDAELLARYRAAPDSRSGRAAVEELLARYVDPVYRWCYRHARNVDDASELAQDVLTRVYESLPTFRERSAFSSWVFAIARNHCLNFMRRAGRVIPLEEIDAVERDDDPEQRLVDVEDARRRLGEMEACLDPTERAALWMRCAEGLSVDEITRELGLENESGARAILQRARRKLRAAPRTDGDRS